MTAMPGRSHAGPLPALSGEGRALSLRLRLHVAALGFLLVPLNQYLFLLGLRDTAPGHAALLYAMTPLGVLLLQSAIARRAPPLVKAAGVAVAVAGAFVIMRPWDRTDPHVREIRTGDMWIADVGQKTFEELTVLRPGQQKGANLGWAIWEGSNCYGGTEACNELSPVIAQDQRAQTDGWTSIIGGQVYRGSCYPDLQGTYFYTDYDDIGRLATATLNDDDTLAIVDLPGPFPTRGASLHEDAAGELYQTDTSGNVFQLVVVGP